MMSCYLSEVLTIASRQPYTSLAWYTEIEEKGLANFMTSFMKTPIGWSSSVLIWQNKCKRAQFQ